MLIDLVDYFSRSDFVRKFVLINDFRFVRCKSYKMFSRKKRFSYVYREELIWIWIFLIKDNVGFCTAEVLHA